jgi:hypothetical protein
MLIEVDPLKDIVELALQAQFVLPYIPINLLLIARPETAKTSMLSYTSKKDFVFYANEVTAKMLIDQVLPLAQRKEIRCLVIPDLLNCIEKQRSTREAFLNFIKSAIEEGIVQIQTYHKRFVSQEPVRFSLLTAITVTDFLKIRKYLAKIGLLSRFVPFSYDYPFEKVKKILQFIESDSKFKGEIDFKIIKEERAIQGDENLFKDLEIISSKLGSQCDAYGFRSQEKLQQLAKANALLNNRYKVEKEDIDKIIRLSNWINYDFNPL